jgi:hypothetical protein
MRLKRKVLLSPLFIVILVIIFGVGIAGAAVYFGTRGGDSTSQKGPVGEWKFDGNAKDSSPNGNHGTVTGATLTTDRKGQTNSAYHFNGTTDHITVSNSAVLNPTDEATVEFWVKPD